MLVDINWWAVLAATASSMLVGSFWYSPRIFGAPWTRLAKVQEPASASSALIATATTVVVSFATATVLAAASSVVQLASVWPFLANALVAAVVGWSGFTAARFVTHDAFEGRPLRLTLLNICHELVTVVVMALIIGWWPPSGVV